MHGDEMASGVGPFFFDHIYFVEIIWLKWIMQC
ncbi:hypothetical protein Mmol_2117 [Methylotenera mobilis JLW8]|uniref:Uncharacterized protein n=1 Tax=Methylotenera mobilis (strain JLW8 / ATCC BAA-1282 / DSM 17540) TaxID=583345 RepID=C6WZ71_METML|nr:hypothetical protein Mmol_2117 [Methylotenera mobilis JLW8]